MNQRLWMTTLALVVAAGLSASAGTPAAPAAPQTGDESCLVPAGEITELAELFLPEAQAAATVCGTCGDSRCDGKYVGDVCDFSGGVFLQCNTLGGLCSGRTLLDCSCNSNPDP